MTFGFLQMSAGKELSQLKCLVDEALGERNQLQERLDEQMAKSSLDVRKMSSSLIFSLSVFLLHSFSGRHFPLSPLA